MTAPQIKDNLVVSIAYTLTADGVEIEAATAAEPLDYLHGHENILPALEAALVGKTIGDTATVELQPEDAYGEYDDDDVEMIERSDLPDDIEPGMELLLEDDDGHLFEVMVKEVTDQAVVLDFNSPLAGKTVTYSVEVVGIREANPDELAHGHPHSYGEDFEYDHE